jgi:hypothetical protein
LIASRRKSAITEVMLRSHDMSCDSTAEQSSTA